MPRYQIEYQQTVTTTAHIEAPCPADAVVLGANHPLCGSHTDAAAPVRILDATGTLLWQTVDGAIPGSPESCIYPQHAKLDAAAPQVRALHTFIDWLESQNITLGTRSTSGKRSLRAVGADNRVELVQRHLGIDPEALEYERIARRRHNTKFTSEQLDKANALISRNAATATALPGVWSVLASDSTSIYLTDLNRHTCTCPAGQHERPCYHLAAASLLASAK